MLTGWQKPGQQSRMLTLRYQFRTTIPIEAECISPDVLASRSPVEIGRLPLQHGNGSVALGEVFDVSGDARDGTIQIEGDCSRVKRIGSGMSWGRIEVDGPVGMHLGAEMAGGEIETKGDAADWVGAHMRGGRIHVRGNGGNLIGGAYLGNAVGMRGGVILVEGNGGSEIGRGMRRGLIAIGGQTGDYAGVGLVAGSIVLLGPVGARVGAGMKRGTIVVRGDQPSLLPTFRASCNYCPAFLGVYFRQLRAWGFPVSERAELGVWRRYNGDLVSLGKGEVLVWQGPGTV